jgi:hypothetical protein
MKIRPVTKATAPKYPDKYNEEIRRVLMASKPARWLGTPLAAGMLAATVALGLSGCVTQADFARTGRNAGAQGSAEYPDAEPSSEESPDILDYVTMGIVAEPTPAWTDGVSEFFDSIIKRDVTSSLTAVIPLFEYGEGTGAIGCVSITAPVFLSEEEAFAIIYAAFAEAGLELSKGGETLKGVSLPLTNMFDWDSTDDRYKTKRGEMAPDGMLGEYDLPVVFVSTGDVEDWHENTGVGASVSEYMIKKTALTLVENNPCLAVFYDPVAGSVNYDKMWELEKEDGESDEDFYARWDAMAQEAASDARAESERLLRMQVDAFIDWLAVAER